MPFHSLSESDWIAIVACLSSFLLILLICYIYPQLKRCVVVTISKIQKAKVHSGPGDDKTHPAFTMSGNLVKDFGPNVPITQHYEVTNTLLGRGGSAEVVIGVNLRTHRHYAIKVISSTRKEVAWRYEREKSILKDIDHTNIVRLFEVYVSPTAQHFVMELCTGGHLGQVLKSCPEGRLDQDVARAYVTQMVKAIVHCHKHGICHRDVKLQNILLESNAKDAQIKLIDFGNGARYIGNTPMTKIVGTTYTAAPEVFKECYDERCDVWSMGVVTYILLSGRRPFEALDFPSQPKARESSVIASILMGRYHFLDDVWEDVNNVAIHFIQCCLELDYKKRRSALDVLNHPWLSHSDLHSEIASGISRLDGKTLARRLSRNLSSSGLRQASMLAVAFAMPSNKADTLRKIFQQIDKSGSGMVSRAEFHVAMETVDPSLTAEDIDVLFDTIDQDGNGNISFIEFVAATIDPREVNIRELNQAFKLLDKDQKGYITKEDLRRVLETSVSALLGLDENQKSGKGNSKSKDRIVRINERIANIVQQADVNHDGVVSYTEFLFAMADGNVQVMMSTDEEEKVKTRGERSASILTVRGKNSTSKSPFDELRLKNKQKKSRRQSDSVLSDRLSRSSFRKSSVMLLNKLAGRKTLMEGHDSEADATGLFGLSTSFKAALRRVSQAFIPNASDASASASSGNGETQTKYVKYDQMTQGRSSAIRGIGGGTRERDIETGEIGDMSKITEEGENHTRDTPDDPNDDSSSDSDSSDSSSSDEEGNSAMSTTLGGQQSSGKSHSSNPKSNNSNDGSRSSSKKGKHGKRRGDDSPSPPSPSGGKSKIITSIPPQRSFSETSASIQKPVEIEPVKDEGLSNLHDVGSTISSMSRESIKKLILDVKNGTYQEPQGTSYLYTKVKQDPLLGSPLSEKLSNVVFRAQEVESTSDKVGSDKVDKASQSPPFDLSKDNDYSTLSDSSDNLSELVKSLKAGLTMKSSMGATTTLGPITELDERERHDFIQLQALPSSEGLQTVAATQLPAAKVVTVTGEGEAETQSSRSRARRFSHS